MSRISREPLCFVVTGAQPRQRAAPSVRCPTPRPLAGTDWCPVVVGVCRRRSGVRKAPLVPLSERLVLSTVEDGVVYQQLREKLHGASVYLVGMMGSGKSTLGAYLAKALEYAFIDTDVIIERTLQKSIPEIFAQDGEETFRDVESLVLESLQSHVRTVVATGGGVVLRQRNWGTLHTGLVVYLNGTPDMLAKRVQGGAGRPLLSNTMHAPADSTIPEPAAIEALSARLAEILSEREHFYRQADVTVELFSDCSVAETSRAVAAELIRFIEENPSASSKHRRQHSSAS